MRLLLPAIAMILSLIAPSDAAAEKITYPVQKIRSKGIQRLQISGVRGKLKIKATKGRFYAIRVQHTKGKRGDDWHLSVDRQGNALVFEVFNVAYGSKWRHMVREELWPEFDVEVSGPSVPAVLSWREGTIDLVGWTKSIEASFLKGIFKASGLTGHLHLQAVDASVTIADHSGGLNINGEKGRLTLSRVTGSVDATWLNGNVVADGIDGVVSLALNQGRAEMSNVSGEFKGRGQSAAWALRMGTRADAEVISESGPVSVTWPGEKATIFLSSKAGKLKVPSGFAVEMREGFKVVERGVKASPNGQIFVRTQTGDISYQ